MAADEQVVPRRDRAQPRPRRPACSLGALPGGADLPGPAAGRQLSSCLLAGEPDSAGHGEAEVRRHPQHVALAAAFQIVAQLGAVAVDLVPAHEVQPDTVGEDLGEQIDGQLPLGPEHQIAGQPHDQGRGRVVDLLTRDPLPAGDQRVPGLLPHIRQVHRGDPVGHLSRAAQIVPLDAGGVLALFDLPCLIDRPDHQAPPTGGLIQARHREPAHHPHRHSGVPDRPVQQPLGLIRRPVPGMLGDRPPVAAGNLAHQRGGVLARLQPRLHPHKTRPQQPQQLSALPPAQPGPYPGGSSRPRFCCRHTHMIARRLPLRSTLPHTHCRSRPEWLLPY